MKVSLDVKTLIIGILVGLMLAMVMGQASITAGKTDFALAIDDKGFGLVRADDGTLYVIDPVQKRAEFIDYRTGPYKGIPFNLSLGIARTASQ